MNGHAALRTARCAAALALAALCGCGENAGDGDKPGESRTDGPLVLVVTGENPTYSYIEKDTGEVEGIEIELARAAAASLGRDLAVKVVAFEELLPLVKSGKADMASSCLSITEGRKRSVDFSIPYETDGGVFLYRTGEQEPTMILAESMRVATIESSSHDFYLARHGIDPLRARSCSNAVRDLLDGKIDALYYDGCTMKAEAAKSGGLLSVSRFETREHYGFALPKGRADLKEAIDAAIAERKKK